MKYVRNSLNYFRNDSNRIENNKEFNIAVKKQNESETVSSEQSGIGIKLFILSILAIIVIVGLVIAGTNAINSMENPDELFDNPLVLYSFFGVFFAIGLAFTFIPIYLGINIKVKCTQESQAKCIGYDDKITQGRHGTHMESCPIYKFNEGGVEYKVYDQKYVRATFKLPAIDSIVPILFDPNDPNRCIIDNKVNWRISAIILGIVFLFISCVLFLGVILGL